MDQSVALEDDECGMDIPVLDPPPGFEDHPIFSEDHLYDNPCSENDENEFTPQETLQVIIEFAENLAYSLLSSAIRPKVKMRSKHSTSHSTAIRDLYSVPPESDVYSVPVDSVVGNQFQRSHRSWRNRHSIAVSRSDASEPIHMSLEEVRCYLREFQTSSRTRPWMFLPSRSTETDSKRKSCFVWTPVMPKKNYDSAVRNKKSLSVTAAGIKQAICSVFRIHSNHHHEDVAENQICPTGWTFSMPNKNSNNGPNLKLSPYQHRALPPVPQEPIGFVRVPRSGQVFTPKSDLYNLDLAQNLEQIPSVPDANVNFTTGTLNQVQKNINLDFAASIEEVKNRGWYWGPLSGEAAEIILSNEPDGSFLVRDSSDDHYIFSLSFKLNGGVRHVRIEHDHGNFSFGSVTRFRSQTMVEFIEKAIEHSRSGRFLFFLHRRPTHGPTRVQLLHPVSRFRLVQSLQHLCRFVIMRLVRRDQTNLLPLPRRLQDYLNTAHYYSEQFDAPNHSLQ